MSYRGGRGGGGDYGPDRRSWRGGASGGGGRHHPYARDDHPQNRVGRGGVSVGGGPNFNERVRSRGGGGFRGGYGHGRGHHYQQSYPPPQPPPIQPREIEEEKIDRTKICPLLLRVYIQKDAHHSAASFAVRGEEPNQDSIVIYTWMDATLRELAQLIQVVNVDARRPSTDISFAFIYPDRTGTNVIKHVQTITAHPNTTQRHRSQEDMKTLRSLKFEIGDFLSIALLEKDRKQKDE